VTNHIGLVQTTNKEIYEQTLVDGSPVGKIGPIDINRFKDTMNYMVPGAASLLDIGCFSGEWLNYVTRNRPSITRHLGIDVAENKIRIGKKLYPNLNLQTGFAEHLELPAESFDIVTCLEALEHIPDWLSVFNSLFRFAKMQVLITVPYSEKIINEVCIHCGKLTPQNGHLRSYTEDIFPKMPGWTVRFGKIRARDPQVSLKRKIYYFLKPHYHWLLADYRRS
jgi:ubiquinone/menaquinone biosynthesis C-methylase UbiE